MTMIVWSGKKVNLIGVYNVLRDASVLVIEDGLGACNKSQAAFNTSRRVIYHCDLSDMA